MHALDVPGWCAIVGVHVPATDPLGAGRHPNLVAYSVVTDHGPGGMGPMALVIARERRIVATRVADAVVDGVVPVVIVIGVLSVPTAIVRL